MARRPDAGGLAPGVRIRRVDIDDAADVAAYVAVVNEVAPEAPTSAEWIAWSARTYPGTTRLLALDGDEPVGTGSTGRIFMHGPTWERYWLTFEVLRAARRRGIGTALWRALSNAARAAGKTGFETEVSETQADGVAFLEHRGFVVTERSKVVRLDLHGMAPPAQDRPVGIALTTLADRPDLAAALHPVAVEAYEDIPSPDEPIAAGPLDEFLARDVHRDGVPPEALSIALDAATGEVVGWASVMYQPGSTNVAWHDMTAVARAWRGRGIATALKRATITWAIEHGLESLQTANDETNAPMRAVNARLGYRPMPDTLGMRGPLAPR